MANSQENLENGQLSTPEPPQTTDNYDRLQMFFLGRLERLIHVKNNYHNIDKVSVRKLQKALDRSIYSTLRDCIEANVGEQAKAILRQEHQHN